MEFALTFVAAFTLAVGGTWLGMYLGRRTGILAIPGGRRKHTDPVSKLGGIGLFAGFFVVGGVLFFTLPLTDNLRLPLSGVLIGSLVVFIGGLADDRYEFSATPQFLVQAAAALIAIGATVFIEEVTLPIIGFTRFPWFITYPITVLWVMGMMNTVNFLDGLDGLAAGVGAIAALLFAIHAYWRWEQTPIALYALALAGACLGFLVFNFHPAKVFLGSSGALVLGFALATLSILAPARVATALLVMLIPIADTGYQIITRWRAGRSPFKGDRGHLHFRLADLGLSQRVIVPLYWLFCAIFGALALVIQSELLKLVALGALGLVVIGVLWVLNRRMK